MPELVTIEGAEAERMQAMFQQIPKDVAQLEVMLALLRPTPNPPVEQDIFAEMADLIAQPPTLTTPAEPSTPGCPANDRPRQQYPRPPHQRRPPSFCPTARRAIHKLVSAGDRLVLCPQAIYEFWAVATRAKPSNGLGLTADQTAQSIAFFRRRFLFVVIAHFPLRSS